MHFYDVLWCKIENMKDILYQKFLELVRQCYYFDYRNITVIINSWWQGLIIVILNLGVEDILY